MTSWEEAITGFYDWLNYVIDNAFFFVNPTILKIFALSFLVLNLTRVRIKWLKWFIIIFYMIYCILRITEIREAIILFRVEEFIAVLPFFLFLLLPIILKNTPFGQKFLNYTCMIVYYLIFNGIWLIIYPEDGSLLIVFMYAITIFLLSQYAKEEER